MFGMENDKAKKGSLAPLFEFDLEKDLKSMETQKEHAKRIQDRIVQIKHILRQGTKKEEYDKLGVLLNAYHGLATVLGRIVKQKP